MTFDSNGHAMKDNKLEIGGKSFESRLMLGTGKYRDSSEMNSAFTAAGSEIITVAFAVVAFSIFVQGLTMEPLMRRLGLIRRETDAAEEAEAETRPV